MFVPKRPGEEKGRKIRRKFSGKGARAAAKQWRAHAEIGSGTLIVPTKVTFGALAEEWLAGAKANPPTVRRKNGEPFKPSYIRSVSDDLRLHVLPEVRGAKLSDITRADVQAFADRLLGRGLGSSRVRGATGSMRTVIRYAVRRNLVPRNPVTELDLPAANGRRERVASSQEARRTARGVA